MKLGAAALLAVAAVVYALAWHSEHHGGPGWVGYVRAAAEAAMVGGLADWFAVTALFRHPLRLPIPHTAIIPNRKDALGRSLGEFVGSNFLAERVIRDRIAGADVAGRIGRWLAGTDHARRVAAEAASALQGAIGVLRDDDVRDVLEQATVRRLAAVPAGPVAGRLLGRVVDDGAHRRLVDIVLTNVHTWMLANEEIVVAAVERQAPVWSPRFVDRRVAQRVHAELVRISGEAAGDAEHPLRTAVDRYLARLATDLREDPDTMARAQDALVRLLDTAEVRRAFGDLVAAARRLLVDLVGDPDSELRVRLTEQVARTGTRMATDDAVRAKVNGWISDAAAYVVTHYRDELTTTITDTVDRWDGEETSRKVELQVGRDLQFIRINGTVVGSLAGLAIHAATVLLS